MKTLDLSILQKWENEGGSVDPADIVSLYDAHIKASESIPLALSKAAREAAVAIGWNDYGNDKGYNPRAMKSASLQQSYARGWRQAERWCCDSCWQHSSYCLD